SRGQPDHAGIGGAEEHLQPLLLGNGLENRKELLLEVLLELLLQLVELGLRVLLEPLALSLLALNLLLKLVAGLLAHHAAARLQLLLVRLERLRLLSAL